MSKQSLGRGLSALISNNASNDSNQSINSSDANLASNSIDSISEIEIDLIEINPYQPRKNFDTEKLNELAASVMQNGIITPITVRKIDNNKFQLIAGERRIRAAKIANLNKIPAYIINASNNIACEIAILENAQREDLSAIEEALGYQNLIEEFNYTQDMVAKRIGKSRSHIANILRILNLPKQIQEMIAQNQISLGHAKILLQSENPIDLANKILSENLTVRQVEKLTNKLNNKLTKSTEDVKSNDTINIIDNKIIKNDFKYDVKESTEVDVEITRLEEILNNRTGILTKITQNDQNFYISFDCKDLQELEIIIKMVIGGSNPLEK